MKLDDWSFQNGGKTSQFVDFESKNIQSFVFHSFSGLKRHGRVYRCADRPACVFHQRRRCWTKTRPSTKTNKLLGTERDDSQNAGEKSFDVRLILQILNRAKFSFEISNFVTDCGAALQWSNEIGAASNGGLADSPLKKSSQNFQVSREMREKIL